MIATLILIALLAPVSSDCACLCIDGAARTVCKNLGDARAKPNLCTANGTLRRSCPLPAEEFTPERFAAPGEGTTDCREARIWQPSSGRYDRVVKVCEATAL